MVPRCWSGHDDRREREVRQEWEPEDMIEVWTLLEEDQERLRNKSGANRLGFALLLKFFEVEARFPEDPGEIGG
ncbi:DUF4158 domain-containing protein [Streptomyces sp. NPDC090621]|uniref:DUF4158 domain-containing protein n=1 Tax=Streptomyces sp. NPDC090621 TaxID=3365966 RepID=UPI003807E749